MIHNNSTTYTHIHKDNKHTIVQKLPTRYCGLRVKHSNVLITMVIVIVTDMLCHDVLPAMLIIQS